MTDTNEIDYGEQAKTFENVMSNLKQYGKCAIVRPTGFGKTWILTEIIKHYNKVLYLYPAAVIRDTVVNRYYDSMYDEETLSYIDEEGMELDPDTVDTFIECKKIEKCTLMTYAKLIRLSDDELNAMDYDLILMDEVHRVGGPMTKIAVNKLFAKHVNAHFVGATATPTRMDNYDVISELFSDIMTYTYTLFDAIESGMIQKPKYCYCAYDHETDLREAYKQANEDPDDPEYKELFDAKLIELAKICNMPNIIKEVCNKYSVDKNYYKFIVFFANKTHMDNKLSDVVSWFQEAFPGFTIDTLKISSRNRTEQQNTDKLDKILRQDKHIDIIACIDMLNAGYHVNNLSGIMMYRGTSSSTIFIQQLGRALSAGSSNSAIVFDIVDNLHRKAVYNLRSSLTNKRIKKNTTTRLKTDYFVTDDDKCQIMMKSADGSYFATQYHLDENNNIVDAHDNPSTLIYDCDTGLIYDNGSSEGKDINNVTADCIEATGHEATYREILAKALAEPMAHRCKYALEIHFRSWCFAKGIPYPISNDELKKLYKLDKNDFYKEFCNIVKANKIDYPIYDADKLINPEDKSEIPMWVCAKAKNVTIENILDMLGVA